MNREEQFEQIKNLKIWNKDCIHVYPSYHNQPNSAYGCFVLSGSHYWFWFFVSKSHEDFNRIGGLRTSGWYNEEKAAVRISLEEVLNICSEEVAQVILYHLDIFNI